MCVCCVNFWHICIFVTIVAKKGESPVAKFYQYSASCATVRLWCHIEASVCVWWTINWMVKCFLTFTFSHWPLCATDSTTPGVHPHYAPRMRVIVAIVVLVYQSCFNKCWHYPQKLSRIPFVVVSNSKFATLPVPSQGDKNWNRPFYGHRLLPLKTIYTVRR